jgi:hypothetical protein
LEAAMKRWLRVTKIAGLLIAMPLAGLYEASTHVVRGCVRGEAFYDGRPTSYWRGQIDAWVLRFDSPKDAESYVRFCTPISSTLPIGPPPTQWDRVCNVLHLHALASGGESPEVLRTDNSAEAVWQELENDEAYRMLVVHARRNAPFALLFRDR